MNVLDLVTTRCLIFVRVPESLHRSTVNVHLCFTTKQTKPWTKKSRKRLFSWGPTLYTHCPATVIDWSGPGITHSLAHSSFFTLPSVHASIAAPVLLWKEEVTKCGARHSFFSWQKKNIRKKRNSGGAGMTYIFPRKFITRWQKLLLKLHPLALLSAYCILKENYALAKSVDKWAALSSHVSCVSCLIQ